MQKTPEQLINALQDEVKRVYAKPTKFIRPKDAATLIILRKENGKTQMLMGKRHMRHVFMPGVYVFPGGKVDLADSRLSLKTKISAKLTQQLLVDMKGKLSENRAKAMPLAAIRETFEETGYLIGEKTDATPSTKSVAWQTFFATGNIPAIDKCQFVARAITPPGGKRRYDTRFFAIWQQDIPNGMQQHENGTDELEGLVWVDIVDVETINAPVITKTMIYELKLQLEDDHFKPNCPIPFYHFYRKLMRRDEISVRD